MKHKGKAVVFETIEDFKARVDDPNLDVDETSVLVLKGAGPKGYPGMPEVRIVKRATQHMFLTTLFRSVTWLYQRSCCKKEWWIWSEYQMVE